MFSRVFLLLLFRVICSYPAFFQSSLDTSSPLSLEPDLGALRTYLPHVHCRLTPLPADTPASAVLSPDGKWVAYVHTDMSSYDGKIATSPTYSVKLASVEEGHFQDVTCQLFANVRAFNWSSDSHWLYLSADEGLWKLDVRSRHRQDMSTPWNPDNFLPVWAPDGQSYLLTLKSEFPLMNFNIVRVWNASQKRAFIAPGSNPRWSPDGSKILLERMYATSDYPRPALWVARNDGTQPKRLVSYDDLQKHLASKEDEFHSIISGSWLLNTQLFLVTGTVSRKDHSSYQGVWIVEVGGKLHNLSGFQAEASADGKHFIIQTAANTARYMLTLE